MNDRVRKLLSLTVMLVMLLSLAAQGFAEGTISGTQAPENVSDTLDAEALGRQGTREVYVSASGDDGNDGSEQHPLATLNAAAERANENSGEPMYIILLSDLTVKSVVRFRGGNVVLMSNEGAYRIARGGDFAKAYDSPRGMYNPAMIELGALHGDENSRALLSVESVIFDDLGVGAGEEYLPQSTDTPEGNENRVQDAIIAVYGGSALTLNPGTELRNFGGLSAVRVADGSTLTVEDGAAIRDTAVVEAPEGLSPILADSPEQVRVGTEALVQGHFQPEEPEESGEPEEPEESGEPEEPEESGEPEEPMESGEPEEPEESGEPEEPEELIEQNGAIETLSVPRAGEIGGLGGESGGEDGLIWTVDPEELYYNAANLLLTRYQLGYTLRVTLPDTLVTAIRLAADQVNAASGSFTVTLDDRLRLATAGGTVDYRFDSELFRLSDTQETPTERKITLNFELADGWKEHLDELSEPFTFTCTGVLARTDFAADTFLISRGRINSLRFNIGGQVRDWTTSSVEKEAKTKMLPDPTVMLTYDPNGGEGGPEPRLVSGQTGYVLEQENVPTHADADGVPVVFLGWTAAADSTIYNRKDSAPDTLTTIDIDPLELTRTVYAVYGSDVNGDGVADVKQELVELRFDANGGSGAPDPILALATLGVGASIDIPEQEPTLKYYTFQGWNEDALAETGKYKYNAAKRADQDILITQDTLLYAVWQENPSYTLFYNANGGSGAPASQTGVSDENGAVEMTIASGVPTRGGYAFLGWSPTRSGAAVYQGGDRVKISNGNVTLYAVWQRNGGGAYSTGGGSGGASRSTGSGAPRTGDEAPIALYVALAVISLGAVGTGAWLLLRGQKKK